MVSVFGFFLCSQSHNQRVYYYVYFTYGMPFFICFRLIINENFSWIPKRTVAGGAARLYCPHSRWQFGQPRALFMDIRAVAANIRLVFISSRALNLLRIGAKSCVQTVSRLTHQAIMQSSIVQFSLMLCLAKINKKKSTESVGKETD